MLTSLSLRNIATISDTVLELGPGLNVLTGETGAGKSILVEGLLLALGDRADRSLVRPGEKLASVEALFAGMNHDDILVRREVHAAGRNRMFIDDELVTLDKVKEKVSSLIDLHTQRSTPSLMSRRNQQESLDKYAGASEITSCLREVFSVYRSTVKRLEELSETLVSSAERKEFLEHERKLLGALNPSEEDYITLRKERKMLETSELEAGVLANLRESLNGEAGIAEKLRKLLSETGRLESDMSDIESLLHSAVISMEEATGICSGKLACVETAPWRLEEIDARLDDYSRLLARCNGEIEQLTGRQLEVDTELEVIGHDETELKEIEKKLPLLLKEIADLADELSEKRKTASSRLEQAATGELRRLNIPHAAFTVVMREPSGDRTVVINEKPICPDGAEIPEFLFSANPGHPPGSLSTVASGGELSRVSLALRLALSEAAGDSTLVFDEIDSGIGGETAHLLADSLCRATDSGRQVIVITHLAQIASRARMHLSVLKALMQERPVTSVTLLTGEERVEEIARILGGGDAARQHAVALLSSGNEQ